MSMERTNDSSAETSRKKQRLCVEILQNCRNELYHYFPYLDGAFASVGYLDNKEEPGIAVNGTDILYRCDDLLKQYLELPVSLTRGYLHMLLHCLFLHIFPEQTGMDRNRWNLACDITVETMIEAEQIRELALPESDIRERTLRVLFGNRMDGWDGRGIEIQSHRSYQAQQIYQMLENQKFPDREEDLRAAFFFDDHALWYEWKEDGKKARAKIKWEKIRAYTGMQQQQQKKKAGMAKGEYEDELPVSGKNRYDYHTFLKQFAIPREEMELDLESFDYIFYHLGMEVYGDMPLIEPLEYKEVSRLEELVIAIDTSGSCSREIVQQFLSETYSILSQRENFFHKMNVYLIQCDCHIQEVKVIHSEEEWKNYCENIRILGRGGTDFRPVFQLVGELRAKKEIKDLKALIYFTDGDGIYPRQKPDYETAFVLLKEKARVNLVPDWALKIII